MRARGIGLNPLPTVRPCERPLGAVPVCRRSTILLYKAAKWQLPTGQACLMP